jgi:hypothetical protein
LLSNNTPLPRDLIVAMIERNGFQRPTPRSTVIQRSVAYP